VRRKTKKGAEGFDRSAEKGAPNFKKKPLLSGRTGGNLERKEEKRNILGVSQNFLRGN